jgi:dTDP-4-dehydrorhamnose 3,5-epimerase
MAKIKAQKTAIEDLIIIEPTIFKDERGYFIESFQKDAFREVGIKDEFVQDNESKSKKGVLRGLHFQTSNPQGKLVRVIFGEVFDVAVDLRKSSSTYGKWEGIRLSGENKKMFFIPPGFAHGFLVLSEEAVFTYKCTQLYDPHSDSGICYNDEKLNINWPISEVNEIVLSEKDKRQITFDEFNSPF